MASGGTLSSSAGCTDHCNCTAKDTGALLTTASLSARRVPVSSGLSIGMLPCAPSAGGGSSPSGRRLSSILNTCVSERRGPSAGALRGRGGACIRRVSPVALASPSAASTSRTLESSNTGFTLRPTACAGGGARPAAGLGAGAVMRGAAGRAAGGAAARRAAGGAACTTGTRTGGRFGAAGGGAAATRAGAEVREGAGATRG